MPSDYMLKRISSLLLMSVRTTRLQWQSFWSSGRSTILILWRELRLILTLSKKSLMSKLFLSKPVDDPQQTVQSILINSALIIVACFVVGVGNVTATIRSRTLAPWNMLKMLRYIPLISFLWKLVLKLEFISSRSTLFLFVYLLQCHQQPTESKLYGFYCAYHMLKLKNRGPYMEVLSWDLHF
jgi:hypothetical protein